MELYTSLNLSKKFKKEIPCPKLNTPKLDLTPLYYNSLNISNNISMQIKVLCYNLVNLI